MEQTLLLCKADACKRIRPNGGAHKMQKRDVQRREQRSNRARSETGSQWIYLSRATHLIQTCVITNNRRPLSPFLFLTRYVDPFFFSFLLSFFFLFFREHAEYVPFDTYIINRGHSDKFMAFEKTFLVLFECKFDVEEERD